MLWFFYIKPMAFYTLSILFYTFLYFLATGGWVGGHRIKDFGARLQMVETIDIIREGIICQRRGVWRLSLPRAPASLLSCWFLINYMTRQTDHSRGLLFPLAYSSKMYFVLEGPYICMYVCMLWATQLNLGFLTVVLFQHAQRTASRYINSFLQSR